MEHDVLPLARLHTEDLRADAARQRLARLAGCCRPSTWRRVLGGLDARVRAARPCCA